jgi:8-oxo-dGTP pyrophosphatase MutT (NUDIX family)
MPSFGTIEPGIEYAPRPGGYAVVVKDGLVAIVKTPRGYFLPGGGADPGEALCNAAIRETKEETGFVINITDEIGTADEFVHSPKYNAYFQKVCTFFAAEVVSRVDEHEPDHKIIWTTPEQAIDLLIHGSQKWAVAKHFANDDLRPS